MSFAISHSSVSIYVVIDSLNKTYIRRLKLKSVTFSNGKLPLGISLDAKCIKKHRVRECCPIKAGTLTYSLDKCTKCD